MEDVLNEILTIWAQGGWLTRISHGDLHKNGEIGGQSRMVRGANQNQPTISPCNRLLKANLNFKGIMAVV